MKPLDDEQAMIDNERMTALAGMVLLVLMVISMSIHMRIGMQVIVEDYVHDETWKLVTLMANTFFSFAVGLSAVFAILRLSFGL